MSGFAYFHRGRNKGFHQFLLVALVACAVGATSSAAVILHLIDAPTTKAGAPFARQRVIWRNADADDAMKTVQETSTIAAPTGQAMVSVESGGDEGVSQTKPDSKGEVHKQHFRKHSRGGDSGTTHTGGIPVTYTLRQLVTPTYLCIVSSTLRGAPPPSFGFAVGARN